MGRRSTVYSLPGATREELNRRIVAAGFGGYDDHAAWLAEEGHAISASAVKRYGKRLRRTAEADAARSGDKDPLAVAERTAGLAIDRLHDIVSAEGGGPNTLRDALAALDHAVRVISTARAQRATPRSADNGTPD